MGTNRGSEKRHTYTCVKISDIRRTISGSALVNIHTLLELEGNLGVNQPLIELKKYREVNENRNTI